MTPCPVATPRSSAASLASRVCSLCTNNGIIQALMSMDREGERGMGGERERAPSDIQHQISLLAWTCLDSLRSIFVCLYSLMCSQAVCASSLMGLQGPKTGFKGNE